MAIEAYLGNRFTRSHENEAFRRLYQILHDEIADQEVILVGNFLCGGCEIDAMVLKHDAIILIDFKNHGGDIAFSENGPWLIGDGNVAGGSHRNPLMQLRHYKSVAMNWLTSNKLLMEHEEPTHIQGLVLFQDPTTLIGTMPKKLTYWFGVADFTSAGRWLADRASNKIALSSERARKIVQLLGVHPVDFKTDTAIRNNGGGNSVAAAPDIERRDVITEFDIKKYLRTAALKAIARDAGEEFDDHLLDDPHSNNSTRVRDFIRQVAEVARASDAKLKSPHSEIIVEVNHSGIGGTFAVLNELSEKEPPLKFLRRTPVFW